MGAGACRPPARASGFKTPGGGNREQPRDERAKVRVERSGQRRVRGSCSFGIARYFDIQQLLMGQAQHTQDQLEQPALPFLLDFSKSHDILLSHFYLWSIKEVKMFYERFKRMAGVHTLLDLNLLWRVVGQPIKVCEELFNLLRGQTSRRVTRICVVFLGAVRSDPELVHPHRKQVIFNIFNFDVRQSLEPQDLALLIKVAIISHARFTRQRIPPPSKLESFVEDLLFKHKISNQHQINRKLLLDWVFQVGEIKSWLQNFKSGKYVQADSHVPNELVQGFKPFRLLKYRVQDSISLYHRIYDKAEQLLQFYNLKNQKFLMNRLRLPTLECNSQNKTRSNTITLLTPGLKQQRLKRSKSLSHNVITVRGKTITRKSVLDIRRYFQTLSNGKEFIDLQDFSKNTENNNLLHPIAISIFKYLSGPNRGRISFRDFLLKVQPKIGRQNLKLIQSWLGQYYQIRSPQSFKKLQLKKKKKKLPQHQRTLLIKLFDSFDEDKKGFLAAADFMRVFKYLYNSKEIEELVRKHNKGGTLNHKQFAAMFLPDEYQF